MKKKSELVNIDVSNAHYEFLKEYAKEKHTTIEKLIVEMLKEALKERKK